MAVASWRAAAAFLGVLSVAAGALRLGRLSSDAAGDLVGSPADGAARTVWTYWNEPDPPAFVELCLRSFERHASRGWRLQVVSKASARDLVGPDDLPKQFDAMQPSF